MDLAQWALVISLLSAIAASAVVWQTWRYRARPRWVVLFDYSERRKHSGEWEAKIVNRGTARATEFSVFFGYEGHRHNPHIVTLIAEDVVEVGGGFSVLLPRAVPDDPERIRPMPERLIITWREAPVPEKPRRKIVWYPRSFGSKSWLDYHLGNLRSTGFRFWYTG